MDRDDDAKGLGKLRESLEKLGKGLESVGEKVKTEVGKGVSEAVVWAEFTRAVAPLLEAAPDGTMTGEAIQKALDDDRDQSSSAVEVRNRRADFCASHGQARWEECLREAGTLKLSQIGGRTSIDRITS